MFTGQSFRVCSKEKDLCLCVPFVAAYSHRSFHGVTRGKYFRCSIWSPHSIDPMSIKYPVVTEQESAEAPPSWTLAKAILDWTRIWSPWWEALWEITHLFQEPEVKMPQLTYLLWSCLLVQTSPATVEWDTKMWVLKDFALKSPYSKCSMTHLGPEYLSVAQLGIDCVWVVLSGGFSVLGGLPETSRDWILILGDLSPPRSREEHTGWKGLLRGAYLKTFQNPWLLLSTLKAPNTLPPTHTQGKLTSRGVQQCRSVPFYPTASPA